jgi:hypothetical protein
VGVAWSTEKCPTRTLFGTVPQLSVECGTLDPTRSGRIRGAGAVSHREYSAIHLPASIGAGDASRSFRATEPLKPHSAQPADIAQLRIVADRIGAALARQK